MKKKVLCCLLAAVMAGCCVACGNSSTVTETVTEESTEVSEATEEMVADNTEDLTEAATLIYESQILVQAMAATQLQHWSTSSSSMVDYFVDEEYDSSKAVMGIYEVAKEIHEYRTKANDRMADAKDLIGTNGSGDLYDAVKEYYLLVNNYLSLVSTYPEGYSKLTFSNTVSDYNTECSEAYNNLSFYME